LKLNFGKIIDQFNVNVLLRPVRHLGVRGTTKKMTSSYLVLVDDVLPNDLMLKTLAHELLHIVLGHFDDNSHLDDTEKEKEVEEMMAEFDFYSVK